MRPYYHYDDEPAGRGIAFRAGWTRTVKVLIAANALAFLAVLAALRAAPDFDVLGWFGMYGPRFAGGACWQPVTSIFIHDPTGFWHLFVNMFGLYVVGGDVNRRLGTRSFLALYFLSGIVGALLCLFHWNTPAIGASGAVLGVTVAFAALFPSARFLLFFIIPVRARTLAIFIAFITVAGILMNARDGTAHWGHLGGMVVGFLYVKALPAFDRLRGLWSVKRARWETEHSAGEEAELDRILEKIHRDGITALTNPERDFLNLMSRKKK